MKSQISNLKFQIPFGGRRQPATRRRRGFTFIEVLVVISMILMLSALVMPRIRGSFQSARLKDGARTLAGFLRLARNTAVLRELPCEIRFDLAKDQYRLVLLDASFEEEDLTRRAERRQRKTLSIGEEGTGDRTLPRDVHFAFVYTGAPLTAKKLPRVIYYADGSATPATVVLQGAKRSSMNIEVYQTTGIAHVEAGMPLKAPDKARTYFGPKADKTES